MARRGRRLRGRGRSEINASIDANLIAAIKTETARSNCRGFEDDEHEGWGLGVSEGVR